MRRSTKEWVLACWASICCQLLPFYTLQRVRYAEWVTGSETLLGRELLGPGGNRSPVEVTEAVLLPFVFTRVLSFESESSGDILICLI